MSDDGLIYLILSQFDQQVGLENADLKLVDLQSCFDLEHHYLQFRADQRTDD